MLPFTLFYPLFTMSARVPGKKKPPRLGPTPDMPPVYIRDVFNNFLLSYIVGSSQPHISFLTTATARDQVEIWGCTPLLRKGENKLGMFLNILLPRNVISVITNIWFRKYLTK